MLKINLTFVYRKDSGCHIIISVKSFKRQHQWWQSTAGMCVLWTGTLLILNVGSLPARYVALASGCRSGCTTSLPQRSRNICVRPRLFLMGLLNCTLSLDFTEELLRLWSCVHLRREESFDRAGFDRAHRKRGQSLQSLSFLPINSR